MTFAEKMTPQRHTGFSWNLGGLLGSALGCSAWIALTPFVTGWHTTGVLFALGCVAVILLAVPILWSMRMKIEALRGMFIFLVVAFVATCGFLLFAYYAALPLLTSLPSSEQSAAADCFWILLLFPALALLFWVIGRSNRTNSEQGGAGQPATRSESK